MRARRAGTLPRARAGRIDDTRRRMVDFARSADVPTQQRNSDGRFDRITHDLFRLRRHLGYGIVDLFAL